MRGRNRPPGIRGWLRCACAGADRFASVGYPKITDEDWRLTERRADRQNEIHFRQGDSR